MIRALYVDPGGAFNNDLQPENFPTVLSETGGLLWVDFEGPAGEFEEGILQNVFQFHPLAVEDAIKGTHVPKVDDWDDYIYVALQAVKFEHSNGGELVTQELDVFLGKNYLVTYHDQAILAVSHVWEACQRGERHLRDGADHLLYRLADEVMAEYMPVIEEMDDVIDRAEDEIFAKPTPETLASIFTLKRAVLHLRRIIGPQREVLNKLARDDYAVIDSKAQIYFRDVYDHLVRLHDLSESIRDLVSGALDTYLSVINNRMNDIMKTLTIITTLFMPITFISGFFGMNYFQARQPFTAWMEGHVFTFTLLLMVLTPIGMFWWMRRRGWM
ncbi:MAG TPA: magnesium/cobalt transporter CorA [Anaerolineales bacterium]|nr:magnesium/cobalt transporter CorA [Anaerolineales bacterium]